jgi:membrane-associated protein
MNLVINTLKEIVDLFLHLDEYLDTIITNYGTLTYAILFFVIFMETGFVVTPFLPGDSLLFAAGTFAALGSFNIGLLFLIVFCAAILGDTVNYWIGHYLGPKVFERDSKFIKKEHLVKTQEFYKKHGGKTIVLARFMPIIRTFAPFVAGVGTMNYGKFISYNILGGFLWTALFTFGGYYFGNIPFVKRNFEIVVLAIIILSLVPIFHEVYKAKTNKGKKKDKKVKLDVDKLNLD